MESYSGEIVANIKQEPETNFSLIFSQHLKSEVIDSIPFEQLTLKQIADSVRPEPEVDFTLTLLQYLKSEGDDSISLDQFTSEEIIDNIKHEPEVHFTLTLPDDPEQEIVLLKEVKMVLKKFDRKWKDAAEMFKSYFVCDKCDYAAKQLVHLNSHLKTCGILPKCKLFGLKRKSDNVEECFFCDLKFDCKNCRMKHQNEDHCKGSNWQCSKCEYTSKNKWSLTKHYQSHVKKFSCEACKNNFAFQRQLKVHQQQHRHGVFAKKTQIKFECKTCDRSFATKQGLKSHEIRFHSKMKFYCDLCGQISKTKLLLRSHMQYHQKLSCPICQHMIKGYYLKRHIKQHSSTAKFNCDECEKVYSNKKALNDHKREKHEIDEVQCDLCSKMFKNKLVLRQHMRHHLKASCLICTKTMSKKHFNDHMEKYHLSGENFLACHITRCQQKFRNFAELKEHKEIHIGKGRYKCLKCDHETKSLQNIERHMKNKSHEI